MVMMMVMMFLCTLLQALMYEDPARWGLTLQTYIQLTVLDHHLSTVVRFIPVFSSVQCEGVALLPLADAVYLR